MVVLTPLTRDLLDSWDLELTHRKPAPPGEAAIAQAQELVSFAGAPLNAGVLMSLIDRDGTVQTVLLNAVVAREMAVFLAQCGRMGGWLDADAQLIPPPGRPM